MNFGTSKREKIKWTHFTWLHNIYLVSPSIWLRKKSNYFYFTAYSHLSPGFTGLYSLPPHLFLYFFPILSPFTPGRLSISTNVCTLVTIKRTFTYAALKRIKIFIFYSKNGTVVSASYSSADAVCIFSHVPYVYVDYYRYFRTELDCFWSISLQNIFRWQPNGWPDHISNKIERIDDFLRDDEGTQIKTE